MRYEIEDRRDLTPPIHGAGEYVVWYVSRKSFGKLYVLAGTCATLAEAKAEVERLKKKDKDVDQD